MVLPISGVDFDQVWHEEIAQHVTQGEFIVGKKLTIKISYCFFKLALRINPAKEKKLTDLKFPAWLSSLRRKYIY